jgi:hypothetical protein
MQLSRRLGAVVALAIAAAATAPASATTLIRQGLDELVANNGTIVVGEVLDTYSYWNMEGTFILTDVRVAVQEVLKGDPETRELTVTVMGGSVGDLTTLIVGGAELVPQKPYVLFLDPGDLPGAEGVRTVRYHSQGVFEIEMSRDGLRAISQASRQPLAPDARGMVEAPGGLEGIPLVDMMRSVRALADHPQGLRREVN